MSGSVIAHMNRRQIDQIERNMNSLKEDIVSLQKANNEMMEFLNGNEEYIKWKTFKKLQQ